MHAHSSIKINSLIRSRFQVKPATLLIFIDLFLCGGGVLWYPVPKWLLSLLMRGVVFSACAGGCKSCNFWTACPKPNKNYIFGMPTLSAFDRNMYGSDPWRCGGGGSSRGVRVFWGGSLKVFRATSTEIQIYCRNPELEPNRLASFLSKLD